jgi:hypothetical protein
MSILYANRAPLFRERGEENIRGAVDLQRQEYGMFDQGEITFPELALRTTGNLSRATIGNVAGQVLSPVMEAAGYMFPAAGVVLEPVTRPVQAGAEYLSEKYPRSYRNLEAGLEATDLLLGGGGAAAARQAGKRVDKITGKESGRGMLLASLDNYIDNFYGRKEVTANTPDPSGASVPLTAKQKTLESQLYSSNSGLNSVLDFAESSMLVPSSLQGKLKNLRGKLGQNKLKSENFESTKETRAAVSKISSVADFAKTGFKNTVKDLFSPESRALFREQGLSNTGKEIIESHMVAARLAETPEGKKILEDIAEKQQEYRNLPKQKGKLTEKHREIDKEIQELGSKLPSRGIPKAVAEAIYQMHIGAQGGRKGGLNEGLSQIALESFVEPYNNYQRGTLSSWFSKHNQAKSNKYDVSFPEGVSNRLEQNIINAHKDSLGEAGVPALVVMKRAAKGKTSGNHFYDLTNTKKEGSPAYRINNAFKALEGRNVNQGTLIDELSRQGLTITGKEADGKVYFSGSTKGSAIVEGGIHVSGYVKPDGTTALIMSDVHDFFENLKPVKTVVDRVAPNSLIAVTPPVFKNFKDPKADISNRAPVSKDTQAVDVEAALEDIASAKPSAEVVSAERMRQGGMLTSAAGVTSAGLKQQEEEGR